MASRISRVVTVCLSSLCAFAYACVVSEDSSTDEQASTQTNGSNFNGMNLNGSNFNGMNLLGFMVEGATKDSVALTNLRVDKGELVAEQGAVTLRGGDLAGAQLQALAQDTSTQPATNATVTYRIASVAAEVGHDPTNTGSTYLYTLEQWDSTQSQWVLACPTGPDGDHAAIPVAAEWDEAGTRTDDPTMFTLGCTSGVIAKCYRWGYRPWVTGYGDLATMHWTCTRLARADYCGNGTSFTYDGHLIDVWDTLSAPGPIQSPAPDPGAFDAGWNTSGATCVSDASWATYGAAITASCPGKSFPVCNSQQAATTLDPSVQMFRAVY